MKKILFCIVVLFFVTGNCFAQAAMRTFNVYFDYNSNQLSEKSKTVLDSVRYLMNGVAYDAVIVNGYTDGKGTAEQNRIVASRREQKVIDYIKSANPEQSITTDAARVELESNLSDEQLRRVMIRVGKITALRRGFETEFRGPEGTIVTSVSYTDPWPLPTSVKISEIFSTRSMIENEWFALDTEGNILRTWGMIEITGQPSDDGEYTVKIPIGEDDDEGISIWLTDEDSEGPIRWNDTKIKIKREKGYYVFKVPSRKKNSPGSSRTRVNLDKSVGINTGRGIKYKTVYIATHTIFKFKDVRITRKGNTGVRFSAKINDTLWAFTAPQKANVKSMVFTGEYGTDNDLKNIEIRLRDCIYSVNTKKEEVFYICKSCEKGIKGKLKSQPDKTKETGFWAWLRRVFGGGK